MFKKSDRIEVIEGRWKGSRGTITQVIPIRVDGREIGERYGVDLVDEQEPSGPPRSVTLQVHQLKKME